MISRRRFIFDAAKGLMVPLAAGRIVRASTIQKPRMPLNSGAAWSPPASQQFYVYTGSITPAADATAESAWVNSANPGTYDLATVINSPKYYNSVQNALPAMRFILSPQTAMQGALPADYSSFTFCAVIKFADVTSVAVMFDCQSGSGCNGFDVFSGKVRVTKSGATVIAQSATTLSTGTMYALVGTYDGASHVCNIYVNSGTVDATATSNQTFTAGALTRIGYTAGSSATLQADVFEFRKGNAVWSSSDISGFISYARTKYGF